MKKDCSFQVKLQEGERYEDMIIISGVMYLHSFPIKKLCR